MNAQKQSSIPVGLFGDVKVAVVPPLRGTSMATVTSYDTLYRGLELTILGMSKFNLAAKPRGHKQRKLNEHVY